MKKVAVIGYGTATRYLKMPHSKLPVLRTYPKLAVNLLRKTVLMYMKMTTVFLQILI